VGEGLLLLLLLLLALQQLQGTPRPRGAHLTNPIDHPATFNVGQKGIYRTEQCRRRQLEEMTHRRNSLSWLGAGAVDRRPLSLPLVEVAQLLADLLPQLLRRKVGWVGTRFEGRLLILAAFGVIDSITPVIGIAIGSRAER